MPHSCASSYNNTRTTSSHHAFPCELSRTRPQQRPKMALRLLSMASLEIAALCVLLSALLTWFYRPRYSCTTRWQPMHDIYATSISRVESTCVSPWAVEYGPNPFIFPAVAAAYNLARVAFGDREERGNAQEELDNVSGCIQSVIETKVGTCDRCGSTFRTPGLLRSV
jgi:hypothetical protein